RMRFQQSIRDCCQVTWWMESSWRSRTLFRSEFWSTARTFFANMDMIILPEHGVNSSRWRNAFSKEKEPKGKRTFGVMSGKARPPKLSLAMPWNGSFRKEEDESLRMTTQSASIIPRRYVPGKGQNGGLAGYLHPAS